jgi:hypothetical protein
MMIGNRFFSGCQCGGATDSRVFSNRDAWTRGINLHIFHTFSIYLTYIQLGQAIWPSNLSILCLPNNLLPLGCIRSFSLPTGDFVFFAPLVKIWHRRERIPSMRGKLFIKLFPKLKSCT